MECCLRERGCHTAVILAQPTAPRLRTAASDAFHRASAGARSGPCRARHSQTWTTRGTGVGAL
eukprot:5647831-Lingulodinium_polyedra.AAC.1